MNLHNSWKSIVPSRFQSSIHHHPSLSFSLSHHFTAHRHLLKFRYAFSHTRSIKPNQSLSCHFLKVETSSFSYEQCSYITWVSSLLLLMLLLILIIILNMSVSVNGQNSYSPPTYPPPPPPPAPFKPSVLVVVAILTTFFSITFLILLYAKHCKRATNGYGGGGRSPPSASAAAVRKNSGVRRAVVESLPVFRFGSLRGPKDGLECAVCLSRFDPSEVLRLLPKCKHAFHVECVDTWLDAHSTCPLCRYRVDPEDFLLVHEHSTPLQHHQSLPPPPLNEDKDELEDNPTQRVSGRHSSAGELRGNKLLKIILQTSSANRRSLDSSLTEQPSSSQIQNSQKKSRLMKTTSSLSSSRNVPRNQIFLGDRSFDKLRKDGRLLEDGHGSFEKRFEHRIMISNEQQQQQQQQRWSDLQPSDLIYLRSEMIINDSNRRYTSAHGSPNHVPEETEQEANRASGRIVNNARSVSEIIGVSRMRRRSDEYEIMRRRKSGHVAGLLSRWLAWANVSSHNRRQPVDQGLPL